MGKYDRSSLIEFCKNEGVTLDFIPEHTNRETRVSGQCLNENCDGRFEKDLRHLFDKTGPFCTSCVTGKRVYGRLQLIEFCKNECVTLDSIPEHINRETKVKGICKTEECNSRFEKDLRQLLDISGPFCKVCVNQRTRLKDDGEYGRLKLLEFCKETGITLDFIPKHTNRESRVSGQCKTENCDGRFEKDLRQLIDVSGPYCKPCTNHRSLTNDDGEYGRLKLLEFCKETGVNLDFIPKHTNRESRISGQCKTENCDGRFEKDLRQLIDVSGPYCKPCTNLEKENKRANTCIKIYGEIHANQIPEILDRNQKARFQRKLYITPSGKEWYLQGYEIDVASKLIQEYGEKNITPDIKIVPRIPWTDEDGKGHIYYCDFYVESLKLIIEVKSIWTAQKNDDKIQRTRKASNELGYDFRLIVLNTKKEWIEDITTSNQHQPCNTSSPS
jgi:transposase